MNAAVLVLSVLLLCHDWYPLECCSGDSRTGDCRPIPCEQIEQIDDGVSWGGLVFRGSMIRTTRDADCHVCTGRANFPDGTVRPAFPHCIFLRPTA